MNIKQELKALVDFIAPEYKALFIFLALMFTVIGVVNIIPGNNVEHKVYEPVRTPIEFYIGKKSPCERTHVDVIKGRYCV